MSQKKNVTLKKGKHKTINIRLLVRVGQTKITDRVFFVIDRLNRNCLL